MFGRERLIYFCFMYTYIHWILYTHLLNFSIDKDIYSRFIINLYHTVIDELEILFLYIFKEIKNVT